MKNIVYRLDEGRKHVVGWFINRWRTSILWASGTIAAIVTVLLFWFVIDPAPPNSIRIVSGSKGGFYERLGRSFAAGLERSGVTVELMRSKGSVDNIGRFAGAAPIDVAFVQGGVTTDIKGQPADKTKLSSIASIAIEPLWLFTYDSSIQSLKDLKGRRIAVGAPGSGTRDLMIDILEIAGIRPGVELIPISGAKAVEALQSRTIDVAAFVTAAGTKWVRALASKPDVTLISLQQVPALSRLLPFATEIVMPRGALDLAKDVPKTNVRLIGVSTNLVARKDLHPALRSLLLQLATEISQNNRLLGIARKFPNGDLVDFPLDGQAKRFFEDGPSLVRNYLPYWLANLVERFWILIIPLLTLLLPIMRIGPAVYSWGMRRRIYRWYADLNAVERDAVDGSQSGNIDGLVDRLDEIEAQVEGVRVPAAYRDEQYHLRLHIDFIRSRLQKQRKAAS